MPKSILVTGSAGFIGSNFVNFIINKKPDIKVVGVDNLSTGKKSSINPKSIFYKTSILNSKTIDSIFKKHKPEYVFHFAALPRVSYSIKEPVFTAKTNINGTITLLENSLKHGVKRFVYSSSSSVYGNIKKIPTTEDEAGQDFTSPYSLQKFTSEQYCRLYSKVYGLDTVSLRYFSVYGPGQYGNSPYSTVISAWLNTLVSNDVGFLEGDGKQTRDFCFVEDVVQANYKSMICKKPLKGIALNIGGGKRVNLLEVKKLIEKVSNKKLNIEKRKKRLGDIKDSCANISLATKTIGYKPGTELYEGLTKTWNWYKKLR